MSAQLDIDVSNLPHHGFDTLDPVWWGNNFLLAIETSMFVIVVATYYYLRQNFALWPPPLAELTGSLNPLPTLGFGTANTILLVLSCIPMIMVDMAARKGSRQTAQIGLVICLVCGIAAITLRSFEFGSMHFRWDANAYGSIVWFILGLHMLHLITLTCETVLLTIWSFVREFDMKHRLDITALGIYWYWVVGVWVVLYGVVYFTPRM